MIQSLYADVALTMGQYLLDTYRSDLQGYKVNVEAMSVDKTLVLPANGPSIIRISVSYDIGEMTASMLIYSIDEHGSRSMDHAQCLLRFEDPRLWSLEWGTTQYLIHRSIEYLEKRAESGEDSRLSRSMIYKMFSTLVDYDPGFMGLESVIFHGEDYEATAKVKLQPPGNMRYSHNPLWIDSFGQLAGFLMNSHQLTPVDQVFINHGWSAMRCLREFEEDKDYRSYVRMRCIDGTTFGGDVYILDDKEIIAVYSGIKVSVDSGPISSDEMLTLCKIVPRHSASRVGHCAPSRSFYHDRYLQAQNTVPGRNGSDHSKSPRNIR